MIVDNLSFPLTFLNDFVLGSDSEKVTKHELLV